MRGKVITLAMLALVGACGKNTESAQSSLHIVGGRDAKADDEVASHTVALVTAKGKTFCSGTLIKEDVVMTAAHCIHGAQDYFSVAFGLKTEGRELSSAQKREPAIILVNKNYIQDMEDPAVAREAMLNGTPSSDIALIVLKEKAPAPYKPAKVLTSKNNIPRGAITVLAGYGLTTMPPEMVLARMRAEKALEEKEPKNEQPRSTDIAPPGLVVRNEGGGDDEQTPSKPRLTIEEARALLKLLKEFKPDVGTLRYTESVARLFTGASEILLASKEKQAACSGDSGGPAYVKRVAPDQDGDRLFAVGVASRSDCEKSAFYTDVRKFDTWLSEAEAKGREFIAHPEAFISPDENLEGKLIALAF